MLAAQCHAARVAVQTSSTSGNFFIDDEVITQKLGKSEAELAKYSVTPGMPLMPDAYVGNDVDAFLKWVKAGELIASVGSLFSSKSKK